MGTLSLDEVVEAARQYYRDGEFSEALSTCEKAEANGLESAALAAVHSATLLSLKHYKEADAFLQEKLVQYPLEDRLYYNLALLKVRQRRPKEGLSIIEDAERVGVRTGKTAAAKAFILLRQMNFRGALTFLKKIIEEFPDEALLHYYLGEAYARNWSKLKAREEFQKAVALDTSLAKAVHKRRRLVYTIYLVFLVYIIVGITAFTHTRLYILPLPTWALHLTKHMCLADLQVELAHLVALASWLPLTHFESTYPGKEIGSLHFIHGFERFGFVRPANPCNISVQLTLFAQELQPQFDLMLPVFIPRKPRQSSCVFF